MCFSFFFFFYFEEETCTSYHEWSQVGFYLSGEVVGIFPRALTFGAKDKIFNFCSSCMLHGRVRDKDKGIKIQPIELTFLS